MKHDSPSSAGDDIPARHAVAAMLGIESKLDQISERLTRMANRDRNTRANPHDERSRPRAPDRPFANILAGVETGERRAAKNFTPFGDRLDPLGPKFAKGLDGFLRNTENRLGERLLETAAQNNLNHIEASEGRAYDTFKAEQKSLIDAASWSTASIESDRPLVPAINRLENHVADLANRLAGHEAAQVDLRKLVQSGFGRLDQRIDATKQATEATVQHSQNQAARQAQEELRKLAQSEFGRLGQRMDMLKQFAEAAAQRAQNQAVRAAQEELRKLAQSEFGRLGQRMDVLKQTAEAAAQRAQNEAIQQAQKDLRDLEGRMQNFVTKSQTSAPAPEGGEIGRLRDEMESLGQRVDDLTVKAASEHDLDALRIAIEQLSARVAQGSDLKPLADLDRRLTEIANKLEQSRSNHVGNQIDAADLDKRIAAAMRQNQISPPWSVIERKFAGFSDRLANTEMQFEHIATLEKWIIQLYRNLEETLDWTRNVAEEAADRMASRLVEEWSGETNPAATSAGLEALEDELAAVRTDHEDANQRNQKALGAVKEALEQIVSKLNELEQIVSRLTELEQLRDELQEASPGKVLAKAAPGDSGTEPVNPEADQPVEMPVNFLAGIVQANHMPTHSLAESADHKRRSAGARHEAGSRLSLHLRKRERLASPAGAGAYAPTVREAAHPGMRHWLIGLVALAAASVLVGLSGIERTKPLAALTQFAATLGSDMLANLLPEASNAAAGGVVIANTDGPQSGIGPANCRQAALHRDAKATFILRFASPTTCRAISQMVYPR